MNEINKLVGERIATMRKYNRINQADLAEKLGKSLRTVQKYPFGCSFMQLEKTADELTESNPVAIVENCVAVRFISAVICVPNAET